MTKKTNNGELECNYTSWGEGPCPQPATYTYRTSLGNIFHLCKEHYSYMRKVTGHKDNE